MSACGLQTKIRRMPTTQMGKTTRQKENRMNLHDYNQATKLLIEIEKINTDIAALQQLGNDSNALATLSKECDIPEEMIESFKNDLFNFYKNKLNQINTEFKNL